MNIIKIINSYLVLRNFYDVSAIRCKLQNTLCHFLRATVTSRNPPVTQPVYAFSVVLQTRVSAVPAPLFVFEAVQAGKAAYRVPV